QLPAGAHRGRTAEPAGNVWQWRRYDSWREPGIRSFQPIGRSMLGLEGCSSTQTLISSHLRRRLMAEQMLEQRPICDDATAVGLELRRCAPCPAGITQARIDRNVSRPQVLGIGIAQYTQ